MEWGVVRFQQYYKIVNFALARTGKEYVWRVSGEPTSSSEIS